MHMLHPEIIKFQQYKIMVPWIWEQPYIAMLFQKMCNITLYIKVVEKISDQNFVVLLYSNLGDKFIKR